MKQPNFLTIGLMVLIICGCSTHRAFVEYNDFAKEMPIKATEWKGESLGAVSGEEGGAIWDDCTKKAKRSLMDMISNARARGANAIGDVKWYATHSSEPSCKKEWGYFIIWPFVLTPLFMSTRVDGVAYKVPHLKAGLFPVPASPKEDRGVAEAILKAR